LTFLDKLPCFFGEKSTDVQTKLCQLYIIADKLDIGELRRQLGNRFRIFKEEERVRKVLIKVVYEDAVSTSNICQVRNHPAPSP
jgi:hypothetical protein